MDAGAEEDAADVGMATGSEPCAFGRGLFHTVFCFFPQLLCLLFVRARVAGLCMMVLEMHCLERENLDFSTQSDFKPLSINGTRMYTPQCDHLNARRSNFVTGLFTFTIF